MGREMPKTVQTKSDMGEQVQVCYSGFWRRTSAIFLDAFILIGGEGLLASIISGLIVLMSLIGGHHVDFNIIGSFAVGFGVVFAFGLDWFYFTWLESSKLQATLGKKIMGLKVTDIAGQKITFSQANVRYWSKVLSALILFGGFWMMFFFKKKQTLHDWIAGTTVIKQVNLIIDHK
jgi:uncharacterized RDD family membrane protein YckC